jgi:membrane-associated phospholipid phosphatase
MPTTKLDSVQLLARVVHDDVVSAKSVHGLGHQIAEVRHVADIARDGSAVRPALSSSDGRSGMGSSRHRLGFRRAPEGERHVSEPRTIQSAPHFWRSKFTVEERYVSAVARRWLYVSATILIVLGITFFAFVLSGVLNHAGVTELDQPVQRWIDAQRVPFTTAVMIVLTITFGPVVLPIIILIVTVVWLLFAKHAWRPLILAGAMISGVIISTTLAQVVHRHRPPTNLMLIGNDTTFSFPSGHVLGASDFLIITAFLIVSRAPKAWGVALALGLAWIGVLAEMFSRMYLGYHWLSDTLASLSISMVIVGTVIAIDTRRTVRVRGERVHGELSKAQTDGT